MTRFSYFNKYLLKTERESISPQGTQTFEQTGDEFPFKCYTISFHEFLFDSFLFSFFFSRSVLMFAFKEEWNENESKNIVFSCEKNDRLRQTFDIFILRVHNVFSVCYLFDVSLLNELYWHLGDITMNMTLDIISRAISSISHSLFPALDCYHFFPLQSCMCGLPYVMLSFRFFSTICILFHSI